MHCQPLLIIIITNGRNPLWGGSSKDFRGRMIESMITECNIYIINDGSPIHMSDTCIDLTIASPDISPELHWQVLSGVLSSDRCHIQITLTASSAPSANIAKIYIPTIKPKCYYPNPWWNDDCREKYQERERLYRAFKRNRTDHNRIKWKHARAIAKILFTKAKELQLRSSLSSMVIGTPMSKIYEKK